VGLFSHLLRYQAAFSAIREPGRKKPLKSSGIFRWPFSNIPQFDLSLPSKSAS
jgi:hypothetical protein